MGKLKFASIGIHHDITYVVFMVKFSSTLKKIHYNVIQKILKYLKAISSFGICFIGDGAINILTTYCNVDYVVDLDDHRSRTSFVLLMNGELVEWGS
jgi:hypothetical protein